MEGGRRPETRRSPRLEGPARPARGSEARRPPRLDGADRPDRGPAGPKPEGRGDWKDRPARPTGPKPEGRRDWKDRPTGPRVRSPKGAATGRIDPARPTGPKPEGRGDWKDRPAGPPGPKPEGPRRLEGSTGQAHRARSPQGRGDWKDRPAGPPGRNPKGAATGRIDRDRPAGPKPEGRRDWKDRPTGLAGPGPAPAARAACRAARAARSTRAPGPARAEALMVAHVVLFRPKPGLDPEARGSVSPRHSSRAARRSRRSVRAHVGRRVTHGRPYEQMMARGLRVRRRSSSSTDAGRPHRVPRTPVHDALGRAFFEAFDVALMYDYEMREGALPAWPRSR